MSKPAGKGTTTPPTSQTPFQSTPSNKGGTGSAAQAKADSTLELQTRVKDVANAIRNDLEKHQQCTLGSMQAFFLKELHPNLSESAINKRFKDAKNKAGRISKKLTSMLASLRTAVEKGPESALYLPYVKLANEILAECRKEDEASRKEDETGLRPDLICVCNDPSVISAKHATGRTYRKPDLVYIHWRGVSNEKGPAKDWEDARQMAEEALKHPAAKKHHKLGLDWSQVLMVDELKWAQPSSTDRQWFEPQKKTTPQYVEPMKTLNQKRQKIPPPLHPDQRKPTGSKRKAKSATSSEAKRQKMDGTEELDGDRPPPTVQLAIYASEMLSVKGMNRAHTLGMLTQNDWTWLWYYDSAGAIQTQGFNILAHTADFVLILMLLRRFNLSQWGFPLEANSKAKLTAVLDGMPQPKASTGSGSATGTTSATATPLTTFDVSAEDSDSKDKWMLVDPTSCVFDTLPVLAGRRTKVYDARDPADHEAHYVAKWSYPQCERHNEAKVVWIAHKILANDPEALSALTEVVAFKDFAEVSTDRVRAYLRQFSNVQETLIDVHGHGERILRCIFEKKLEPLRYLSDVWFVRGMHNCFRAHYLLWKGDGNHRVEHTDISYGNYGVDPKTLEIKLRDFDLARLIDSNEASLPQSTERTGTIPYMALDLLTRRYWDGKVRRLYRHDAEGAVWVIAAQAWLYNKNGVEVKFRAVDAWFTADYEQCRKEKKDFLDCFEELVPDHHADIPEILNLAKYVLMYVHRAAFARQMNARRDWWEDETTIPEAATVIPEATTVIPEAATVIPEATTVIPEAATKQSNPLGLSEDDVKDMDSTFHKIDRCFERVLPRKRVLRPTDSDIKRFKQRKLLWAKRARADGRTSSAA